MKVDNSDIVPIYAAFNYSTLVVLPEKEEIMSVDYGDDIFWKISPSTHSIAVKPQLVVKLAKKQIEPTNINITAASGNVYSLIVSEVSSTSQPSDLRVILEQKDARALTNIEHPEFIKASALDELKKQLEAQAKELAQAKQAAGVAEAEKRNEYEWKVGKESARFGLTKIYQDGVFTYIKASSQEAPTLYELDGKHERIIQYTLEHGLYVVPKVIDHGCLRVGKSRLEFRRSKETA